MVANFGVTVKLRFWEYAQESPISSEADLVSRVSFNIIQMTFVISLKPIFINTSNRLCLVAKNRTCFNLCFPLLFRE